MPTIGTDCHITLLHASVNGGAAAGFLLWRPDALGADVEVTRTGFMLPTGHYDTAVKYVVPIVTGDKLSNPDGSARGAVRAAEYALYLAYLAAGSDITLAIPGHTFSGLYALGSSKEKHYTTRDELMLVLTNGRIARDVSLSTFEAVRSAGDIDISNFATYTDVTGLLLAVVLPSPVYTAWLSCNVRITGATWADLRITFDGVEVATVQVNNVVGTELVFPTLLSVRVTDATPGMHTLKAQAKFRNIPGSSAYVEGGSAGHAVARFSAINW